MSGPGPRPEARAAGQWDVKATVAPGRRCGGKKISDRYDALPSECKPLRQSDYADVFVSLGDKAGYANDKARPWASGALGGGGRGGR